MSSSFKTKLNGLINDFSMNKKIKPSCNKTDNNSSISNIILTNFKEISTPKSSKKQAIFDNYMKRAESIGFLSSSPRLSETYTCNINDKYKDKISNSVLDTKDNMTINSIYKYTPSKKSKTPTKIFNNKLSNFNNINNISSKSSSKLFNKVNSEIKLLSKSKTKHYISTIMYDDNILNKGYNSNTIKDTKTNKLNSSNINNIFDTLNNTNTYKTNNYKNKSQSKNYNIHNYNFKETLKLKNLDIKKENIYSSVSTKINDIYNTPSLDSLKSKYINNSTNKNSINNYLDNCSKINNKNELLIDILSYNKNENIKENTNNNKFSSTNNFLDFKDNNNNNNNGYYYDYKNFNNNINNWNSFIKDNMPKKQYSCVPTSDYNPYMTLNSNITSLKEKSKQLNNKNNFKFNKKCFDFY